MHMFFLDVCTVRTVYYALGFPSLYTIVYTYRLECIILSLLSLVHIDSYLAQGGWERFAEAQNCTVYRKPHQMSGLYMYKGENESCTHVYMYMYMYIYIYIHTCTF